jgi:hypothetical protein
MWTPSCKDVTENIPSLAMRHVLLTFSFSYAVMGHSDKSLLIVAETNLDDNPLDIPLVYDKSHLVSMSLTASLEQLASQLPPGSHLSQHQLSEFRNILLLYLDFKQKERFTKLHKLRQSQGNLPIAQYK